MTLAPASTSPATDCVDIVWRGRTVSIEHCWLHPERQHQPLLVFLHEGLGSVAMWRDFPARLVDALGWRGLVYSRPGYGRSTQRAPHEHWQADFLHRQADEVLPALLHALRDQVGAQRPWLLGHSDGGSIALLYAAHHPQAVAGAIVVAPHIFVEDVSIESIASARETYLSTDLRQRLGRYHDDPDSAFWGWNDIWLHPTFRNWNISHEIARISCPLLAMQGTDDEYGTLEQVRGIARVLPHTSLLEIDDCGHSPHRDQADTVIAAIQAFVRQHT